MKWINFVLISLIMATSAQLAWSDTLNVAVASNFIKPMRALSAAFADQTSHTLRLTTASSGKLYAQITHGAPYDVFFSADQEKPQQLINTHLAQANSLTTYAIGRLVLWAPNNPLANAKMRLQTNQFNRLALANPRLAPYGLAAKDTLTQLGLLDATQPKWVTAENIAQSYQFVFTANAALGFVAYSQVHELMKAEVGNGSSHNAQHFWLVPEALHTPIKQEAVIIRSTKHSAAAQALISFVQSQQAKAIIAAYGYQTP